MIKLLAYDSESYRAKLYDSSIIDRTSNTPSEFFNITIYLDKKLI